MTRWAGSGAVGIALSIPGSLPAETGIGGTQILEAYRLDAPGAYLEPHALIAGNPAWAAFTGSHLWADAVDSVDQRRTDTRKGYSVLSNLSAAVDVPRRWHDADWKAFALASAGRSSSGVPERRSYVQAAPGHSYAQRYEWNRGTGFGRLEVGLAARRPSGALGLSLVADCAGDRGFSSSAQLSETTVGPDLYRFAYRFESRGASRDLKIGLGLGAVRRVWPRWAVEQTLRYETATSRFHGHYAYGLEYDYGGWKHSESFDFEFAGESRRHDVVLRVGAIRTAADRWWLRAGTEGRWSQSSGRFRAWGPAVPSGWAGQASARQRRLELRWLRVEGAYRAQNTDTFLFAHIGSREARFALSSGGSCWGWGAEQPLFGRRFHVVFRRPMLPCEPSWLRTYGVRSILDFIVFGYSEVSVRLATHRSISTELSLVYRWRGGRLEPETARIVAGVAW